MYGRCDCLDDVHFLLYEDVSLDFLVFSVLLKTSCGLQEIRLGNVSNIYVGNALIDMYVNCGNLNGAKKVFVP